METVELGRTGLRVARVGLGAAPLGSGFGQVTDAGAAAVLAEAARTPGVLIDTAPFYGMGQSESRVGRALALLPPGNVILSTKVGRLIRDGAIVEDYSHDGVLRSFEESQQRLSGRSIDIVHVHDPDHQSEAAVAGAFKALAGLKQAGAIRAVSAGMNQWQMLSRFVQDGLVDCVLLAGRHTLLDQSASAGGFLAQCQNAGVGLILGGVFNSGVLADPDRTPRFDYAPASAAILARTQRIRSVCESHGVPLRAAAIQFSLRHPAVSAVILGVAVPAEWRDNLAMADWPIPTELWESLAELDRQG